MEFYVDPNAGFNLEAREEETLVVKIQPDDVNVLMGDRAKRTGDLKERVVWDKPEGRAWIENWRSVDDSFQWTVEAPREGQFEVALLLDGCAGDEMEIIGPQNRLAFCRNRGGWDKLTVPGELKLPKGRSSITLKLLKPTDAKLKSVELIDMGHKSDIEKRIKQFRSDTKWLGEAKYGLMFQWGQWGYPQHGRAKPWSKMIDDFNVESFAKMVEDAGGAYVIWSATWRTYYFPAPIRAIDEILPGRTSKRDLIADLSDALNRRGIKLMLYYHEGHGDRQWWKRNWVSCDDKENFYDNWCRIITEVGLRYKDKLAGWWFDDGMLYYPAPFERLGKSAKAGFADRLVSYNSWVLPRLTEFQDVYFGEGYHGKSNADLGDDGVFTAGPQKGLQSHGMFILDGPGWGIWRPDTKISVPAFTAKQATEMVRHVARTKQSLSLNLLMYEDGSVSRQSLDVMRSVRKVIRGNRKEVK